MVNEILTQASVLYEISDVQATALANHITTLEVPTLYAFPMGVSRKQEKSPHLRGLLYLAPDKKERLQEFLKTLYYSNMY